MIKTRDDIGNMLAFDERYSFLGKEPLVGNIILLGLGGSYAYGTNNEDIIMKIVMLIFVVWLLIMQKIFLLVRDLSRL